MDISFESKEIPIYREYYHQTKRIQESAECVVPDTDADIEKIAAVQSRVYLKSKDLSARGVLVTGELTANVLYIRDGKNGISSLNVRQPFSIEFETEAPDSETLAQVALTVQGTDVRLINPRKISVGFEAEGELSCYCTEKLRVESMLPENTCGLHVRTEESSYLQESLPTLTLVRAEGESLWSLAKKYHSSEEMILEMNENADQAKTMLLIPKCI